MGSRQLTGPFAVLRDAVGSGARLTASVAVAAVAWMLLASLLPMLAGWQSTVVLSESMRPSINAGDVVSVQRATTEDVRPGMVILARNPARPGQLLLHRVVGRTGDGRLITKGDANREPDATAVAPGDLVGIARMRIPYIGLPVMWSRTGHGRTALLALVAAALVGAVLYLARRGRPRAS